MTKKKLIVIGGGAAGFFCAVNAAKMNIALEIFIVEKSNKLLSKVKISGGGRCNVTHACFSIADMIKKYPRGGTFLKKAFHHFFTTDTINWFAQRGVALKTETDGRMFPVTNSSQTIIDCLLKEANKYNVKILMNAEVAELVISNEEMIKPKFEIKCTNNKIINADYVCVASGGYPKLAQFKWLQKLGHTIANPVPSLFTFNLPHATITSLMGVVVENVQVKISGTKLLQQGALLITHWGMSGPVILKLSAWGATEMATSNWHFTIAVNWIPDFNETALQQKMQQLRFALATQKMINRNPFSLPTRLWEYVLQQSEINADLRWANLPAVQQNKLIKNLCMQEFEVKGKTTFKEEFVTCGGIQLNEIDFNTLQSKKVPNIFFAGEVINIDGITGGFNFQSAWTTAWIAAKTISTKSLTP